MGCVSSKAAFRRPKSRKRESFPLPELGEGTYVNVAALGSKEIRAIQAVHGAAADRDNFAFGFAVLALALVDDDGSRLFCENEPEDLKAAVAAGMAEVEECMNLHYETFESLLFKALNLSGVKAERPDPEANGKPVPNA